MLSKEVGVSSRKKRGLSSDVGGRDWTAPGKGGQSEKNSFKAF